MRRFFVPIASHLPCALSGRSRTFLSGGAAALASYLLVAWGLERYLQGPDRVARDLVNLTRHPLLSAPLTEISRLGAAEGLIPLIAMVSVLLWRRRPAWALGLPLLMAGTGALQFVTKWLADRPRPNLAPWGFPSGHVLSLVVFFGLLAYFASRSAASRRRRYVLASLCVAPVAIVAYSRLYLDVHWLSDLAGGFLVGTAYLLLVLLGVEVASTRRERIGLAPDEEGPQRVSS